MFLKENKSGTMQHELKSSECTAYVNI